MRVHLAASVLCIFLVPVSQSAQPASAQPTASNPTVTISGSLRWERHGHTATLLPSGEVLAVGGGGVECYYYSASNYSCYITVNDTAELYDPTTGLWRLAGKLSRRSHHSASLLPNGHLLVIGGVDYGVNTNYRSGYLDTSEVYDPASGVWRPTQSTIAVRGPNNSVLLPNGQVLVVGSDATNQTAAELFDPSTQTWRLTGAPSVRGPLTLLPAGEVLTSAKGVAELYDPITETWTRAGDLNRISNTASLTLLRNGLVLATGTRSDYRKTAAELYDPATRTWRITGDVQYGRHDVTATLLSNGHVLLAGGYDPWAEGVEVTLNSMELYDPVSETWTLMPSLSARRGAHTATLLPNDKVLIAAGIDENWQFPIFYKRAELFDLGLPLPGSLSISPDTVSQGQCFSIIVDNGARMTLDVQYRLDGGPIKTLTGWPELDESGRADNICTSEQTPSGTFEFIAIRNTDTTQWVSTSTSNDGFPNLVVKSASQ